MPSEALLLDSSLGALAAPLRVPEGTGRGILMYSFAAEYRAWLHILPVYKHTRSPMVMARVILCRAYVELGLSFPEGEARAKAAQRRRRAWITIDGRRWPGVSADGADYRSVAVAVEDRMVVAVVPVGQAEIGVQLTGQK